MLHAPCCSRSSGSAPARLHQDDSGFETEEPELSHTHCLDHHSYSTNTTTFLNTCVKNIFDVILGSLAGTTIPMVLSGINLQGVWMLK